MRNKDTLLNGLVGSDMSFLAVDVKLNEDDDVLNDGPDGADEPGEIDDQVVFGEGMQ